MGRVQLPHPWFPELAGMGVNDGTFQCPTTRFRRARLSMDLASPVYFHNLLWLFVQFQDIHRGYDGEIGCNNCTPERAVWRRGANAHLMHVSILLAAVVD